MSRLKSQNGYGLTEYTCMSFLLIAVVIAGFQNFAKPLQHQVAMNASDIAGTQLADTAGKNAKTVLKSSLWPEQAREFAQGFVEGLKSQIDSISQILLHPVETINALKTLSESLINDPLNTLKELGMGIVEDASLLVNGSLRQQGKIAGENISPSAFTAKAAQIAKAIMIAKRTTDKNTPVSSVKEKPELAADADVPEVLLKNRILYENLEPDNLKNEILDARAMGIEPVRFSDYIINAEEDQVLKWVVTDKGELIVATKQIGENEVSHAVLNGGRPVYAAGEVALAIYPGFRAGISLSNHTGHYKVNADTLDIAQAAFKRYGLDFTGVTEFTDYNAGI